MSNSNIKNKIWKPKEKPEISCVNTLIEELGAPRLIANILCQRGIDTPEKVKKFYNPRVSDLYDPFLMKDMDKAIERIQDATEKKEGVLIFGDYDVDGTTSVALAYSFFRDKFEQIEYYIPDRYKEGYGISKQGIDYAKENGLSLIIALDCGIRSVELIDYANSLNIDFIICDHHLPGDEIPDAIAVLDPKRSDCEYPFKELAGCGIGLKLAQAYCQVNDLDDREYLQYLDFTALSIASDIVPIVDENRILAYYGLRIINEQPRIGIRKLIEVSVNKPKLGIGDLVFYLGPRINAAGRMDDAKSAVKMLIANNDEEAMQFAKELETQNAHRKTVDAKITADLQEIVSNNPDLLKRKTLVFYKEDWHKGVVGIAASRAIELYYRPTIILTKSGDVLAGSARSIPGFDIHEALHQCKDHLLQFGGHKYAAGMTLELSSLEGLRESFEKVGEEQLTNEMLTPKVHYDAQMDVNDIDETLLKSIQKMEPFGPGNMTPVFRSIELSDNGTGKIIGQTKEHLRLNIKQNSGQIAAVGFGMANKLEAIKKADSFEACFQINENVFNGYRSIQLMLKDIRITNGT
ncbi:MAG: single-stranded-DNA-specific exonuclease RecJ [Bacteroidia bacterium]|nr:single-stranded-DNA-specific exonuclease RecJ [Bacteroidia bacterium]NNJ54650.1 single-stranded-DNA-specific exonuclease RecJ [Bacteroidia bacterium]